MTTAPSVDQLQKMLPFDKIESGNEKMRTLLPPLPSSQSLFESSILTNAVSELKNYCLWDLNILASSMNPEMNFLNNFGCSLGSDQASQDLQYQGYAKFNIFNESNIGQKELPGDEDGLSILNGYKYSLSYIPSKGPRRRKRIIHCQFPGCTKQFIKAWNFLDHARMHLGEKPFQCKLWRSSFTQKGNLKKHMKKHQKGH